MTGGPVLSTEGAITRFTGPYAFMSNFEPGSFRLRDPWNWLSGEHAFQAFKTEDPLQRARIAGLRDPGDAKAAGRRLQLRGGWDDVRKRVMLEVLLAKFTQVDGLRDILAATWPRRLVEGNTWHDNYWGDCMCGRVACAAPGLNWLGRELMMVRDVLRVDS